MTTCTEFAILVTVGNEHGERTPVETLDKGQDSGQDRGMSIRAPVPDTKADILESQPSPSPTALAQLRGAGNTAAHNMRTWSGQPDGRLILPSALIATLLAIAAVAGAYVAPRASVVRGGGPASLDPSGQTAAPPAVGAELPGQPSDVAEPMPSGSIDFSPTPGPGGGHPADVLTAWATPMAGKTGIPTVALKAYAYAELIVTRNQPACKISWTTLAGIGKVESDHGRAQGATLQPDGKALPAIIGLPLDGQSGRQSITDTDGGQLDTDRSWDRAVGPMQFIPSTWKTYAVDADNDGITDINNIYDAALAAANYLCANNRDLSKPSDWMAAIGAYNAVNVYINDVYNATNDYGRKSRL